MLNWKIGSFNHLLTWSNNVLVHRLQLLFASIEDVAVVLACVGMLSNGKNEQTTTRHGDS